MSTRRKCGGYYKPTKVLRVRRAHARVRDTRVMRLIMSIFTVVMICAIIFILWCLVDLSVMAVIN